MIPKLMTTLERKMHDVVNGIHTSIPAEILEIDEEKMLLTLQPLASYYVGNVEMDYPVVPGVPLCITANVEREFAACAPIKVGDIVLMLCTEQSISAWLTGTSDAQLNEKFELQNTIAIGWPQKTPIEAQRKANEEDAFVVVNKETEIVVKDESIEVKTKQLKVEAEETIEVIAAEHIDVTTEEMTIHGNVFIDGYLHANNL